MIEEVGGTIDWAKNKLDAFPKAKKDLGPLLDALGRKYFIFSLSVFLISSQSLSHKSSVVSPYSFTVF